MPYAATESFLWGKYNTCFISVYTQPLFYAPVAFLKKVGLILKGINVKLYSHPKCGSRLLKFKQPKGCQTKNVRAQINKWRKLVKDVKAKGRATKGPKFRAVVQGTELSTPLSGYHDYEVCSRSIRIGIVMVVHWVWCVCNQSWHVCTCLSNSWHKLQVAAFVQLAVVGGGSNTCVYVIAIFTVCESTEQRICIKFCFKIGKTATETYQLL